MLRTTIVGVATVLAIGLSGPSGAQQTAKSAAKAPAATGQVTIEVGLVLNSGNVLRIVRTEFLLVRRSVAALLMEKDPEGLSCYKGGVGNDEDLEVNTLCDILHSPRFVQLLQEDQPRRVEAVMAAVPNIKKYTAQTVQTDFNGKATFTAPAGKYWVFGCYSQDPNSSAWNVPVVVTAGGRKSLILDQNNATGR